MQLTQLPEMVAENCQAVIGKFHVKRLGSLRSGILGNFAVLEQL